MDCLRCHTPLPENSKFCFSCGADMTGGGVATATSGEVTILQSRLQRVVQGEYEIKQLLGQGGMGAVFLAHDLTLEREVAIKVLPPDVSADPQVIKRFQQEAKTAAKLDHTNIIPIYRVESEDGLNYFVMKYVPGTSLEDALEQRQPMALAYIQRVLWEAACALGHAHTRGVVHRDVKPANIMFDHDGRVMLTDFGISKALQTASAFTGTGMIIGTPHYMAPEQAKGAPVDGRADQYSLGVVGYRMVMGELPFGGDSVHTVLYKHIFEEPPKARRDDVPEFVTAAIARALAKDPDQRFASMEAFATALWPQQPVAAAHRTGPRPRGDVTVATANMRMTTAPTTPMPASGAFPPPRKARPGSRVALVLAVLVVAAVGGYLAFRGRVGGAGASDTHAGATGSPSVSDLQVAPAAVTLRVGERATLSSRAFDSVGNLVAGTPVSWASNNPQVARVDTTGAVTAVAAGAAVIEARAGTQRDQAAVQVLADEPGRRTDRPGPGGRDTERRPPPPAAADGFITVGADPFGTVYVDGVQIGPTPVLRYGVTPGRHTVRVERPGYRTITETVQVDAGNQITKRYTLIPEG
jgi:serine/threonine-protein kinase